MTPLITDGFHFLQDTNTKQTTTANELLHASTDTGYIIYLFLFEFQHFLYLVGNKEVGYTTDFHVVGSITLWSFSGVTMTTEPANGPRHRNVKTRQEEDTSSHGIVVKLCFVGMSFAL